VALFQLESSSNEEMEFERVRFRELGCGCSYIENIDMHCRSPTAFFCRLRAWPPQPSRVAPTAIGATKGNLLSHPKHVNSKI
jgi:hypothetical protein